MKLDHDQSDRHEFVEAVASCCAKPIEEILSQVDDPDLLTALLTGVAENQSDFDESTKHLAVHMEQSGNCPLTVASAYALRRLSPRKPMAKTIVPSGPLPFVAVPIPGMDSLAVSVHELTYEDLIPFADDPEITRILARGDKRPVGRGAALDSYPITDVSSSEAFSICNALSDVHGLVKAYGNGGVRLPTNGYRLPTLAEWQMIASHGAATVYFFGDSAKELPTYANINTSFSDAPSLMPVGSRRPSPRGIFDLYGNAAEAVHAADGPLRQVGGSSWATSTECLPAQSRPFVKSIIVGIRPIRTLSGENQ